VFPGVFRGALDHGVKKITPGMKIAVAKKLASLVKKPGVANIIPSVMDKRIVKAISSTIK
jgi:malate dehydrogenase (oxaloacetate-decarboxylating)